MTTVFGRRFGFGLPPTSAAERLLSLGYRVDLSLKATEIRQSATARLDEWDRQFQDAVGRLTAVELPRAVREKVEGLLGAAYLAGIRFWVGDVLGAGAVVGSFADLNAWCTLQIRALQAAKQAFPLPLIYPGGERFPLSDRDLFDEAAPLFDALGCSEAILKRLDFFGGLEVNTPHEDWRYYSGLLDCLDEYEVTPPRPDEQDLTAVMRRAKDYIDQLPKHPGISAPQLKDPIQLSECEALLGQVIGWCSARVAGEQEDGPVDPDRFWFRGRLYDNLTPGEQKLLSVLWLDRQGDRWSAETRRLSKEIYGAPFKTGAVRSTKRRLSMKLSQQKFPGELMEVKGHIILQIVN